MSQVTSTATISGVAAAEVLFDMLISSDLHAVWALQTLDQTADALLTNTEYGWERDNEKNNSKINPANAGVPIEEADEAEEMRTQARVALQAAGHEKIIAGCIDVVIKVCKEEW